MENRLQLTANQSLILNTIFKQKAELQEEFKVLSEKEAITLSLVFENHNLVNKKITNLVLENNELVVTTEEEKPAEEKQLKKKK